MQKIKRQSNMELLRIVAMFMVVTIHYLSKGDLLSQVPGTLEKQDLPAWILNSFAIPAVNIYVLVSGYFLCDKEFRLSRLVKVWTQVIFYSIGIPVILMLLGILDWKQLTIYQILQYIFPILMSHYWFVTAYIFLLLLSPFLNEGMKKMDRNTYSKVLISFLILFSVSKTLIPVIFTMDEKGYDVLWFVCLYLTAGYFKHYGIPFFDSLKKSLVGYLIFTAGIFLWFLSVNQIALKFQLLEDRVAMSYDYNHLFVYFSSIALFSFFYHMKGFKEKASAMINKAAQGVFGVYLIHEHVEIRFLWTKWFGVNANASASFSFLRFVCVVFFVMIFGICIDLLRGKLFQSFRNLIKKKDTGH